MIPTGIETEEKDPPRLPQDRTDLDEPIWAAQTGFLDPLAVVELFGGHQASDTQGYPAEYTFRLESPIVVDKAKWTRGFNTYILEDLIKGTTIGWRHGGIPSTLNQVCHAINCGQNALDMMLADNMIETYADSDSRNRFRVGGDGPIYHRRLAMHRQAPLYGYVYPIVLVEVLIPPGPDELCDSPASVLVTNRQGMAALSDIYMANGAEVSEALSTSPGLNDIFMMPHHNGKLAFERLDYWRLPGSRVIHTSDTDVLCVDVRSYPDARRWWNPHTTPTGRRTDYVCLYDANQHRAKDIHLREIPSDIKGPGLSHMAKYVPRYSDKEYFDFTFAPVWYHGDPIGPGLGSHADKTWMAVLARKGNDLFWDPKLRWDKFTVLPALRFPQPSSVDGSWSNDSANRLLKLTQPIPEEMIGATYQRHDDFVRTGMPDYCEEDVLSVINKMLSTDYSDLQTIISPEFDQCESFMVNLVMSENLLTVIDRDVPTAIRYCANCALLHSSPEATRLLNSTSFRGL